MFRRIDICAVAWIAWSAATFAADYPTKPIRFINPTAPGGTAEPIARVIAQKMGAPPESSSPEQLRVFLRDEIRKFAAVVEIAGAKID